MKKQLAAAALKYAGKKMAANASKKFKKGVERVERAIKANPKRKTRKPARKANAEHERENPYEQKGASYDLFGGESRALPKKVSEFHRPRVRVRGGTMTLAEGSPFKGRVVKLNPLPRIVSRPLRVTLTAAEVKESKGDLPGFVAKLLQKAAQHSTAWDHIEARGPGGRHLFDVVP